MSARVTFFVYVHFDILVWSRSVLKDDSCVRRYVDNPLWWGKVHSLTRLAKEPLHALRVSDSKVPHLHKCSFLYDTVQKSICAELDTALRKGVFTTDQVQKAKKKLEVRAPCSS